MKKEMYREKISEIQESLTDENKTYFKSLYDTIFLSGALLYKEKAMLETSYNLLLDLLDAQCGGEQAIDYFGMTSDEMAKKILQKMEKETPAEIRKIIRYVGISALFWTYFGSIKWLSDNPLGISWLSYVVGLFCYILTAIVFFRVILKLATNNWLKSFIPSIYIVSIIGILTVIGFFLKDFQVFYIPALTSKIIGVVFAVGYGFLTYATLKESE